MRLRPIRTNRSASCWCQGTDSIWKNLDYSSLVIFSIFPSLSVFVVGRLISYINIYHLLEGKHYIISFFSPVSGRLEFSSLEVKYLPCWFSLNYSEKVQAATLAFCSIPEHFIRNVCAKFAIPYSPQPPNIGQNSEGDISIPNFWLFPYKRELS